MTILFSRHRFPPAIIRHAVWLFRFTLSYRDVEDLLAGADSMSRTKRCGDGSEIGPMFAQDFAQTPRPTSRSHLNEMAVTIAGRRFWLGARLTTKARFSTSWSFDGEIRPPP